MFKWQRFFFFFFGAINKATGKKNKTFLGNNVLVAFSKACQSCLGALRKYVFLRTLETQSC